MRAILFVFLKAAFALALIFGVILGINYFNTSIKFKQSRVEGLAPAGGTISVLNWNIGYAGLGKESDFIMDGGENLLPPSKEIVLKNLSGIQKILDANKADFVNIQEVSKPDMLTFGVDVLGGVKETLAGYDTFFSYDFRTQFIPRRSALKHGLASFAHVNTNPVEIIRLPLEPNRLQGLIQRQYHIQAREFTDKNGNQWALLNLHLSAFDEGGSVRMKQLKLVIETADALYEDGKYVVIGGDWNLQLASTDFAYTTKKEDLFWLAKFPHELVKEGWQVVVDARSPTVRSNERPYQHGENYTTVIDGFYVSPNVDVVSIKTINTDFEYTDHQPVMAVFKAK